MTSAVGRCRIQQNADDDWQILPPAGQITRIGDAVGFFVAPVTNNDMLVGGDFAAFGAIQAGARIMSVADSELPGEVTFAMIGQEFSENVEIRMLSEEMRIIAGTGAAGVVSPANMFQPNCIVLSVFARVTQAPGGGATTFDIYRTGIPADVLIDDMPVAVDGMENSIVDSDGTHDGPFYNPTIATLTIKTNVNVTGSDLKVRVGISYIQLWNFES